MIIIIALSVVISFIVGAIFWVYSKNIVWFEWVFAPIFAIIIGILLYYVLSLIICVDTQTLSGFVISTKYEPYWVEEDETRDSNGKIKVTHTTHYPTWYMTYTTGEIDEIEITQDEYNNIVKNFGGKTIAVLGYRPDFDYGDRNDYITNNETRYLQPVVIPKKYINRLKNSTSLFVKSEIQTIEYPYVKSNLESERLLGVAKKHFNLLEFDRMNARLGSVKKVNVIIVGFASENNMLGNKIEAQWQGGKKNDLVICYGKGWAYCFGWTEKDIVKRNLESIFLEKITPKTLSKVEKEIRENYVLKDWNKFNYIDVNFPLWTYFIFILVLGITQFLYFYIMKNNDLNK